MLQDILTNIQGYYDSIVALLPKLALALVVLAILIGVARVARNFAQNRLSKRMDDPLLARFIASLVGLTIVITALLMALQIVGLGNIAIGLLSTAGVGAFVIGFAFKDIGENFLAGIVLAFNRPFRVGDIVEIQGFTGKVNTLNLRDIQLKTFDGKDIFIPNSSVVKNPVVNHTLDGFLREEFTIRLYYSADINKATNSLQVMLDEATEVLHEEGMKPEVVYGETLPTGISLIVRYWVNSFTNELPRTVVKKRLFDRSKRILEDEQITLPADLSEVTAQHSNRGSKN